MNKFKRTDFSGSKEAEGKKVTKCIKIELTSTFGFTAAAAS